LLNIILYIYIDIPYYKPTITATARHLCVVPATMAELNASKSAVDAALSAANNLTSQINTVNMSIITASDDISKLLTKQQNNSQQMNQLDSRCEYQMTVWFNYSHNNSPNIISSV